MELGGCLVISCASMIIVEGIYLCGVVQCCAECSVLIWCVKVCSVL